MCRGLEGEEGEALGRKGDFSGEGLRLVQFVGKELDIIAFGGRWKLDRKSPGPIAEVDKG